MHTILQVRYTSFCQCNVGFKIKVSATVKRVLLRSCVAVLTALSPEVSMPHGRDFRALHVHRVSLPTSCMTWQQACHHTVVQAVARQLQLSQLRFVRERGCLFSHRRSQLARALVELLQAKCTPLVGMVGFRFPCWLGSPGLHLLSARHHRTSLRPLSMHNMSYLAWQLAS